MVELHFGALGSAHFLDRIHQREILRGFVVDLRDEISGLDAGPMGRRVPSMGAITARRLSFTPIWIPTPPNSPLVSTCISLYMSRRHVG